MAEDLNDLNMDELMEMAKDLEVKGRSTMNKDELLAAVEKAQESEQSVPETPADSGTGAAPVVIGLTCFGCGAINLRSAKAGDVVAWTCGECGRPQNAALVVNAG